MTYSEEYFQARESWRDWRIEARELIAGSRVSAGALVLELGCGGGGLLRLLRERGARAIGIDADRTALELAARRKNAPVIRIDKEGALPFRSNTFDAVIGQHVIEHMADWGSALGECHRVLQSGGRLMLVTPNIRYPDPSHFADGDHVHIFSPQELCAAVAAAGLAVDSCSTLFPYLSRLRLLRMTSVLGYHVFARLPYLSSHGRTILLKAHKA